MILSIELTETGRRTVSVLLLIVHFLSIICGSGLCAVGVFLRFVLKDKVNLIENYDGDVLPIVLMVVGGLTTLVNVIGCKLAFDACTPVRRKRLRYLLIVQLVLLLINQLALLTAGSMCFAHRHHLSRSFHNGLIKAMAKYQEVPAVKHEIDLLQMQYRCCGNSGYEDWFDIQWINNMFIDLTDRAVQSKMTTGQYLTDDVPFSCCSPTSPRPCVHHRVHDNNIHVNYDYQTGLTLHVMGCKEKLMMFFGSSFNQIGAAAMGLMSLQMLAVLLARYLQTSINSAIDGGDPEMPAPGFLCPGAPGVEEVKGVDSGDDIGPAPAGPAPADFRPQGAGEKEMRVGIQEPQRGGSMEDFEDHDLDVKDGYDTLLDDSTFDDDFTDDEEPIYANIQPTSQTYPPQEDMDRYDSEPVYANIATYAAPHTEQLSELATSLLAGLSSMPPPKSSGPPPPPPPEPAGGSRPPKRPNQPPPQRPSAPPKRPDGPPPRPSQPPSSQQRKGRTPGGGSSKKGPPPARPTQPPSKRTPAPDPRTSTPKKTKADRSAKPTKTHATKSSPKHDRSPKKSSQNKSSPERSSPKKSTHTKSSMKASSPKSPRTTKSKPSSKSTKSHKPKARKSAGKSRMTSGKSAAAPKRKMSPPKTSRKSATKSRSPKKSTKRRSRNKNNNILMVSSDWSTDSESVKGEEISDEEESTSASSEESFDDWESESESTSGLSDESDASSDTPLLR